MAEDDLYIFIQILSCKNILIGDKTTSDPYVKIKSGDTKKDYHQTKHILKTLNPVYSLEHNNTFILTCTKEELNANDGVLFKIKDWDRIGKDDDLGFVHFSPNALLETCDNYPLSSKQEYSIQMPKNRKLKNIEKDAGTIELLIRYAKEDDLKTFLPAKVQKKFGGSISSLFQKKPPTPTAALPSLLTPAAPAPAPVAVAAVAPEAPPLVMEPEEEETEIEVVVEKNDSATITEVTSTAEKAEEKQKSSVLGHMKSVGSGIVRGFSTNEEDSTKKDTPAKSGTDDQFLKVKYKQVIQMPIEIVHCRNLLIGDKSTKSSDPYVKVKLGDKDLHETKHILKTLNPDFTKDDNSTFNFNCSVKEVFDCGGLRFKIKDWDRIGANDDLGDISISAETLHGIATSAESGTKITKDFPIEPPEGRESENDGNAGTISIRFGPAISNSAVATIGSTVISEKINETAETTTGARAMGAMDDDEEGGDELPIIIEIVSCRDLLIGDKRTKSSDPYVKIKLGKEELHRTNHILKTLNPVYSAETNSTYCLDVPSKEVEENNGLHFVVKDWDRVGSNDDLGSVNVPSSILYKADGTNMEFALSPPKGSKESSAGFLTIRCRVATPEEKEMNDSKKKSKGLKLKLPNVKNVFSAKDSSNESSAYGPPDTSLLIEIVSCRGLIAADKMGASDPYVKVTLGKREVHKTSHIDNDCNPIYTIKTKSLFILDVTKTELSECNGLTFTVYDYDFGVLNKDDGLGYAKIPCEALCGGNGERMEFKLHVMPGKKERDAGYLYVRCRHATDYDKKFMAALKSGGGSGIQQKSRDLLTASRGISFKPPKTRAKFMRKDVKEVGGVKKFKIRPGPDPESPSKTEWMSKEEILAEALKPSRRWLDVSNGKLGKVYVEVIGCDGIPNMDTNLGGDVTDPYVAIVFEDAMVKTDCIDDCLSPKWLPWMERAFCFRMMHSSSNLYVGVFDSDFGPQNDDDLCGRVSVDLTKLRPNTEYMLKFNLYKNSVMMDRVSKGTITLRVRVEIKDEKQVVLSNLSVPQQVVVSVADRKDFFVANQTVHGDVDMKKFSTTAITFYISELTSSGYIKYYIQDAIESLIFWRGQVSVFQIYLPIHSLIVFLSSILLAERPTLFPSFFFFGIAHLFLAIQNWRNSLPNPWTKTKSFEEIVAIAALGKSPLGPSTIEMHKNEEESKKFQEEFDERVRKAEEIAAKKQEEYMKLLAEHEKLVGEVGEQTADADMSSDTGTNADRLNPLNVLKPVLYPIQQYLKLICEWLRFLNNLLTWEEPYYATLLVIGLIAIGFVLLFVPWAFLTRWITRIVAWGLFGPHMKLVDMFWYSKLGEGNLEDYVQQNKDALKSQFEYAKAAATQARLQKEELLKLKDMKAVLFGKYHVEVPVLRFDRLLDVPLHTSEAKPYSPPQVATRALAERVPGQTIKGHMIPKLDFDDDDEDDERTQQDLLLKKKQ